jgi:hypothetical protein
MVEYKPWLEWQEQAEKEAAQARIRARTNAVAGLDAGDIHPVAAGAGIGAVVSVPALMVILALLSPSSISDGGLVVGGLTAPIVGAALGALVGQGLGRLAARFSR